MSSSATGMLTEEAPEAPLLSHVQGAGPPEQPRAGPCLHGVPGRAPTPAITSSVPTPTWRPLTPIAPDRKSTRLNSSH